jgi:hypothetical protein
LARNARRLDRLNAQTYRAIEVMRAGARLYVDQSTGRECWRLQGREINPTVARLVIKQDRVIAVGDTFLGAPSQTYRWRPTNVESETKYPRADNPVGANTAKNT